MFTSDCLCNSYIYFHYFFKHFSLSILFLSIDIFSCQKGDRTGIQILEILVIVPKLLTKNL